MIVSPQHLFHNLVEAFHQDAASDHVGDLAMQFTAAAAERIYLAKRPEAKLLLTTVDALTRLEGVHLLLSAYGLALTARRWPSGGVLVGVRILPRPKRAAEYAQLVVRERRVEGVA